MSASTSSLHNKTTSVITHARIIESNSENEVKEVVILCGRQAMAQLVNNLSALFRLLSIDLTVPFPSPCDTIWSSIDALMIGDMKTDHSKRFVTILSLEYFKYPAQALHILSAYDKRVWEGGFGEGGCCFV